MVSRRLTSLLDNRMLSRVERLRINTSLHLTNRTRGEHLSGGAGSSIDFSDYRDYAPGDDIRYVDWNIFSRLHRPYLKLYMQEEEMHVVLLVDGSASMGFEGKLRRAGQLAAIFGIAGLLAGERVSVHIFNHRDAPLTSLSPCRGRAAMKRMLAFLEAAEATGDTPVEEGIEAALKSHCGRGVAVVLSDMLTFGEPARAFNLLAGAGLEIFAVQILAPSELDPDAVGDLRLVDSESGATLDVSAAEDLLAIYHEHRLAHQRRLEQLCRQRSGRFVTVDTGEPIESMLLRVLIRRGWLR
jgi:uncharacterized protein (DUF58 family)